MHYIYIIPTLKLQKDRLSKNIIWKVQLLIKPEMILNIYNTMDAKSDVSPKSCDTILPLKLLVEYWLSVLVQTSIDKKNPESFKRPTNEKRYLKL